MRLSVNPMLEETITPYQYTYQNPIRFTDPTGLLPEGEDPPKMSWFGRNIYQPVGDFLREFLEVIQVKEHLIVGIGVL